MRVGAQTMLRVAMLANTGLFSPEKSEERYKKLRYNGSSRRKISQKLDNKVIIYLIYPNYIFVDIYLFISYTNIL